MCCFYMAFHNKADLIEANSLLASIKRFYFIHCGNREVPECVCYVFGCTLEMTKNCSCSDDICVMLLSSNYHIYVESNYEIVLLA